MVARGVGYKPLLIDGLHQTIVVVLGEAQLVMGSDTVWLRMLMGDDRPQPARVRRRVMDVDGRQERTRQQQERRQERDPAAAE